MYEQYTDKQIVEMLKPKLNKCTAQIDWDVVTSEPDSLWGQMFWGDILKAISIAYRSGYIRSQLGRSFIIGEKNKQNKQTEHWVPATKDNVKVGSKVKMIDEKAHLICPDWHPIIGTMGVIKKLGYNTCEVQWHKDTTSENDKWWCTYKRLEVLLCE